MSLNWNVYYLRFRKGLKVVVQSYFCRVFPLEIQCIVFLRRVPSVSLFEREADARQIQKRIKFNIVVLDFYIFN